MIDWSQPRPLSKVTEDAGFTMSDVAFVSGLDESTVSRLWDDPRWLDRVSGRSLQSLAASVPGVAEYFASHSVLARRNSLVKELQAEGLVVNRPALLLSAGTEVPHQYLINALEAALSIMRGDERRACSYLARFWGLQQNRGSYSASVEATKTNISLRKFTCHNRTYHPGARSTLGWQVTGWCVLAAQDTRGIATQAE